MRILMLVNWKIKYCKKEPKDIQPPDYYVKEKNYWFYRHFKEKPDVDVLDISSFAWLEKFEKEILHFYVWQALKAILNIRKYDLIVSHGMQSGVVLSFWRRMFRTKAKHIVFDIGSFNSASEKGLALKMMQFASKSIDGIIYHTSEQKKYYHRFFPWLEGRSQFIRFGTDADFFCKTKTKLRSDINEYILCVGYNKRDWDTLIKAYSLIDTEVKLRLVGHVEERYKSLRGVEQIPYVSIRDLMDYISNARFCVLPLQSFNYSYGQMTLMQQMALGKCVVAAKVPSLIDYIEDWENALTYEPGNSKELSEIMIRLLQDQAMVERIGEKGRLYVKNILNEKTMAREIESYYAEILR